MVDCLSAINCVVPNFLAAMTGTTPFQLSDYAGKMLVIYFYPKDNTPGCTTESIAFRELHQTLLAKNTLVFGLSRDSIRSHDGFKAKLDLPFQLISDPDESVCTLFNVMKLKNMYGKQHRGIERSTFVIDGTGTLVKEWRGVKIAGHADEVLEFIDTASQTDT